MHSFVQKKLWSYEYMHAYTKSTLGLMKILMFLKIYIVKIKYKSKNNIII